MWLCRAAAVAAACLIAAPALADITVKGDQAAYNEVLAAFKKLYSLSGFRMKIAFPGSGQAVMEMVPPDKFHTTGQMPNGNMEIIRVGNQSAIKMDMPGAPSGWRCTSETSGNTPVIPDPSKAVHKATGTVEFARGPDTVIEGTPVHTYISTYSDGSKDTIYVGSQTGLPRRTLSDKSAGGGETTIDYYDYGANIVIALPSCASH
jgi:hypothetical protein